MALLSLITKKSPTLSSGQIVAEFDAVLEDTLEASVTLASYPIEVGSRSNDHRIKNPIRWQMVGGISNNPLKISVTDFTGLLSEVSSDNGLLALSAGFMAGWLAGDKETRSSDVLQALMKLMYEGDPFDVDAGDIQLSGMVIESIRRTKDASNENGLIFSAQLVEWQDISTAISAGAGTATTNAATGTPTASASSNFVQKGQQAIKDAADSVVSAVEGFF